MKLIIDINDNEYIGIKEYPDNVTSYPVTIHLYDAVKNGIPLDDVLDKIRTEIEQIEINGHIRDVECFSAGINTALNVIDKYRIIDKYKGEQE